MEGVVVYFLAAMSVLSAINAVLHRLKKENDVATYELVWSFFLFVMFLSVNDKL